MRPGYQAAPPGAGELESLLSHLLWLEPYLEPPARSAPPASRLRYLFGAGEAHAVFRLPFPPEAGIPGAPLAA